MAVRDDRGDVKQTTTGFRGPLMVQSLTSAKSKFLSLKLNTCYCDLIKIKIILYENMLQLCIIGLQEGFNEG